MRTAQVPQQGGFFVVGDRVTGSADADAGLLQLAQQTIDRHADGRGELFYGLCCHWI